MLPHEEQFWQAGTPREARNRLLDALRFDLLGPEAETEHLHESPLTRYTVGMLAPFGTSVAVEENEEEFANSGSDEETGAVELGPPMSQALTPSSIGLSFLVSEDTKALTVQAEWGDYERQEIEEHTADAITQAEKDDDSASGQEASKPKRRRQRVNWVRTPQRPDQIVIHLRPDAGLQRVELLSDERVFVEHVSRKIGDRLAVSVFLVNRRNRTERSRPPVDRWVFQPLLRVRSKSATPEFLPRDLEPSLAYSDRDRESNRLLFRNRREFAVGHGCSSEWSETAAADRAFEVRTQLVPTYELPRIDPQPVKGMSFEMERLASVASGEELRPLLMPLLDEYGRWIEKQDNKIRELSSDLQKVARAHVQDCRIALERMQRGVTYLLDDRDAFEAFRFANNAMLLQRSHTAWAHERRRSSNVAPAAPRLEGSWRPFQLAFILLNLNGIADISSDDRTVGDLLWFPTGGGKTEAYLGLTAFTLALRRLRTIGGMRTDAGVAVLMRYTLRLLTIQQFQRASTLLCACEVLRRDNPGKWGDRTFTIGLWLGQQGTPNTHDDSRRSLLRLQKDPSEEGPNPCVLESCPWCGHGLTADAYRLDGESRRTRVTCPRLGCDFSKAKSSTGLPVLVVDEEIYRECPSMLIATVDKFAQMPWNGDVQSIFGFVNRECDKCGFLTAATEHSGVHRRSGTRSTSVAIHETERLAPPDLIIQDELHLITGPLGTLVGLYEGAVDYLSARWHKGKQVGPKVIASTATMRRAFEQVQAVFHRRLSVFPPPGLDPEDSFFAVERTPNDETPGRLYVGISAPGKSMKTAYIRVAASLLSSAGGLRRATALAEPYLTLVSYYNSLRELGGAIRLLDDDVPARLEQLKIAGLPVRNRPVYRELTSRIPQQEIPTLLRRLELRHDAARSDDDFLPLDVVLASNMISVGVDIDRLGLMTVTGQPKTTAEYIQATSRVGRQSWGPGLVLTLYNWSRPRDLSHLERFQHYHATLYRNVEAVSATPFSTRALDRGLRGTYVAMTRLGSDEWSPESGASEFSPQAPRVASVIEALRLRATAVAGAATGAALEATLKGLGDEWWGYRKQPLRYGWRSPDPDNVPDEDVLLRVPEGGHVGYWPAPQSLREVEEQSPVRLLGIDVR